MQASNLVKAHKPYGFSMWLVLLVGLTTTMISSIAHADSGPNVYSGVLITDIAVQTARQGGNSELRFRLVNEGMDSLTVIGVESNLVAGSKILARTKHGKLVDLGSISVPAEGTLNLHSSHLKIELTEVKHDFLTNQTIPLNLLLMRGKILIEAHVHALQPDGHIRRSAPRG